MTEMRATAGGAQVSKLRPTAKEFVFNASAPSWTPPAPAAAPAPASSANASASASASSEATAPVPAASSPAQSTSKKSVLKPSAKAFVPNFMAPAFVPASIPPPMPAAVSAVSPVIVGQRTDTFVKRSVTTVSSTSSSVSTTTSVASEPEAEDRPDAVAAPKDETPVAVQQQNTEETSAEKSTETATQEAAPRPEATVGINGAVQPAEIPRTVPQPSLVAEEVKPTASAPVKEEEVTEKKVEAEPVSTPAPVETSEVETEDASVLEAQKDIEVRLLYTIKQLLSMEPDDCPMPPGVKGMVIAADKTSKTSVVLAEAPARGNGGSRGGGSRRSLSRHNSTSSFSSEGGRGRRDRGGRGRGGGGGHHHDTAPALEDCEPLNINEETRWKPSVAKSRLDEPEDTTEASIKEAKSILNKLSIEKFEKLSDQLIVVAVRGLEVLKGVIEMVIEKAQMEWHFSAMYAELCAKLAKTSMPAITLADDEVVTDTNKLFRKLLLQRCQKEFEEKPTIEGLEELAEEERQEKELLVKRATLGHIRFVGELFKQRMLSSRIMHECIGILFGDITAPDEESLECLCKLLGTIGQALEINAREAGEREHINKYYGTIKQLSGESKLLCTRVRFMLQDLLELRRNNWVARRKETKAMTIAEVHAEVAREAKEKERASAKGGSGSRLHRSQSMNSTGFVGGDRRRGGQNGGAASAAWKMRAASSNNLVAMAAPSSAPTASSAPQSDDGWSTVGTGTRPKLLKSRSNSDRIPSSMSGAPRHPNSSGRGAAATGNAFASLRQEERSGSGRKERSRSNSASSNSSRAPSSGRPPMASSAKPSSPVKASDKPEPLSADAFEKKAKAILQEFVELRDLKEATTSVTELHSAEHHTLIATQAFNLGLEKGDKERSAVSALLAGLFDQQLLSTDALMVALDELLEFIEDMEIDIPRTLPYLSEMLAPTVAAGGIPLQRLVASVQHITYNGKAAKLVCGTLAAIQDEAKVRTLVEVDSSEESDESSSAIDFASLLAEEQRGDEAALRAVMDTYALQFLL